MDIDLILNCIKGKPEFFSCIAAIAAAIAAIVSLFVAIKASRRENKLANAAKLDIEEQIDNQSVFLIIHNNGNGCARNIELFSYEVKFASCGNRFRKELMCPKDKITIDFEEYSAQYSITIRWEDDFKKRNKKKYYGGFYTEETWWKKMWHRIKKEKVEIDDKTINNYEM